MIVIKYIPFIIAFGYFISCICTCFGIVPIIIPNIIYMSPVTSLFILCASFAFRFCIWHRLSIYYALVTHAIVLIDYYSSITLSNWIMLFVYLLSAIITILLGMYNRKQKGEP